MAKIDLRDAYRMIPIHLADRSFLGVSQQGSTYMDLQLPFSLHGLSTCNLNAVALEWILKSRAVCFVIHYLDNFLLLGQPMSGKC